MGFGRRGRRGLRLRGEFVLPGGKNGLDIFQGRSGGELQCPLGDIIFCHIAGKGFVGIGICTSQEVPANNFVAKENGIDKNILDCAWVDESAKMTLNPLKEYFLGVHWIRTVPAEDGYWEKGMKSVPMVAYTMNDGTTHNKVLQHFCVTLS